MEATLAQAQATLPPLQKQLVVQRDLLTALIGWLPSQEPAEKFELATCQAIAIPAHSVLIVPIPPYPRVHRRRHIVLGVEKLHERHQPFAKRSHGLSLGHQLIGFLDQRCVLPAGTPPRSVRRASESGGKGSRY